MKLTLGRIAELIPAVGRFDPHAVAAGYSIDSRTLQPGQLFFAVKGERLDGHDFVRDALARGAVAAVVQEEWAAGIPGSGSLLVVEDSLKALQMLAARVRQLWGKPLIAVTGSAGKTTTKEVLAGILAVRYRVLKSEGNLNNHFGLPLQLLRLDAEHDLAVIEMGMSHAGEITALSALAQATAGVVTNVAPVHLGFFKSVAEIARAKQELITALPPDGIAILNADDEYVSNFGRDFAGRVVTYGIHHPADVRAEAVEQRGVTGSAFEVVAGAARASAELRLIGGHNIYNALAALAAGLQYGISLAEAVGALALLRPVERRGQVLEIAGATVVNDCYNSNPKALDSMVDALAGMKPGPQGRRIVVAGEMLELGTAGEELHRRCGLHLAEKKIDLVIGVRGLARHMVEAARRAAPKDIRAEFVDTPEQAGEWLAREIRPGDVLLLKASRGVRLEQALEAWRSKLPMGAAK